MDKQTYKWIFLPTMTYFKNRKDAKALLGANRFGRLIKEGKVIFIETPINK